MDYDLIDLNPRELN